MRSSILAALVAGTLATDAAQAAQPARGWLGINTGLVAGDVEKYCVAAGNVQDCSEGGLFQSYGANLTFGSKPALRVRGLRAEENTEHKPNETAVMIGGRLGRSDSYLFVGRGHIRNVDDGFNGDADGFAWEWVTAPSSTSGAGLEVSVFGNYGPDVDFTGFSLGLRFGQLK